MSGNKEPYFMKFQFNIQLWILKSTYALLSFFVQEEKDLVVIGVDEIANSIKNLEGSLKKAYTVNFSEHKFYAENQYNFDLKRFPLRPLYRSRALVGPFLLAYLACKAKAFIYIGNTGFLHNQLDGRFAEFEFLQKKKKIITAIFCGSDIRSPALSIAYSEEHDVDVMMTYLKMMNTKFDEQRHEEFLKKVAHSADTYADHIFNAPTDQISYIKRPVMPFPYFQPDESFSRNDKKFEDMDIIKIFHAPSSPFVKGTPIVRATLKKLKLEGYNFEYTELQNVPHGIIIQELRRSHIVINELYAFVPGVFGIEALASHCALITSADEMYEKTLPSGSNEAWIVTHYWELYDNLKKALDDPSQIKIYADRGYAWANEHCRASRQSDKIKIVLEPRSECHF